MGDKTQLHGFYCNIVIGAIHIAPIAIAPSNNQKHVIKLFIAAVTGTVSFDYF